MFNVGELIAEHSKLLDELSPLAVAIWNEDWVDVVASAASSDTLGPMLLCESDPGEEGCRRDEKIRLLLSVAADIVFKVNEGRPHVGDEILNNRVQLVINTPLGRESFFDDRTVRRIAMMHGVPCITTLTGAAAAVNAIRALSTEGLTVRALQEYHAETATGKT